MSDIKVIDRGERGQRGGGSGSSEPTGDPNTQAYFGPDGVLTDDRDATMTKKDWKLLVPGDPTQAVHVNRVLSSMATGVGSTAPGTSSSAEGLNTVASGANAHAEGANTIASGNTSHAEGVSTVASGAFSHAEGGGSVASGDFSHAEGNSTQATGDTSHAEGSSSVASGTGAHAEGNGSAATNFFDHAEGSATIASGGSSHASGIESKATRESQNAYASAIFGVVGDCQTSRLVLRGTTPGAFEDETVELSFGVDANQTLQLEDGKTYAFKVTAACGGVQSGPSRVSRSIEITFNVRRDGGLSVITGSGTPAGYGDANTAAWTLVATIGVAPDRVVLTFSTGSDAPTSACHVAAKVEFTEAAY